MENKRDLQKNTENKNDDINENESTSMKLEKEYIRIEQGNFTMYLLSLTSDELINYTQVDFYENNKGYQRQLITNHYRKIAKYLETESEPILPPAILAATEPDKISCDRRLITISKQIRVVDGQHRIQGLRYLKQVNNLRYSKIANFEYPVILMVINKKQRIHEVNTFVNINSKGKKVSTDLAILLRDRIREEEFNERIEYLDEKDFEEAIATRIAKKLFESSNSVWFESIKMAAGDEDKGKPISINAFNQSIKDLVRIYIRSSAAERTPAQIGVLVAEMAPFISSAWDTVLLKWQECFNQKGNVKHNDSYNIQKGIGVYPLHQLLSEALQSQEGSLDDALKEFRKILKDSDVEYTEWKIGGILSSYNSRAGFKIIADYIKNEIDYTELIKED